MAKPVIDTSVHRWSRTAGAGYLGIIVTGILAEFVVRSSVLVSGETGATAANIAASATLYRSALAAELVMRLADVLLASALYIVFRPASRSLAFLTAATLFGIIVFGPAVLAELSFCLYLLVWGVRIAPLDSMRREVA